MDVFPYGQEAYDIQAQGRSRGQAVPAVLICTPSYSGEFPAGYVSSLLRTIIDLPPRGVQVEWLTRTGNSLLPMARNFLAAHALTKNDWTHLLLVDADIEWQPEHILRLMTHDLPFVCGAYRMKEADVKLDFIPLPGKVLDPVTGLLEVRCASTGFVMLKREVLLRLTQAYPASRITQTLGLFTSKEDRPALPHLHDFFPLGFQDGVFMSEDFAFSERWRAIDGQVWLDPEIELVHASRAKLHNDLPTMLRQHRSNRGACAE